MSRFPSTERLPGARAAPCSISLQRGSIRLKVAETAAELEACQKLRYKVFYEDGGADADGLAKDLDADGHDEICDHLLVSDGRRTVGTCRLLRQDRLSRSQTFYSQREFDLAPLLAANPRLGFLELGRSCVLAEYRTRRIIDLLWQGIWNYVRIHEQDVMIGCASLVGTDKDRLAAQLAYLHRHHLAPEAWRVKAHPDRRVAMDAAVPGNLDLKAALKALPPLIKGYLRLGGHVGDGAVIDDRFGVTDVFVVLPVSAINPRYFDRFGSPVPRLNR